MEKEVTLKSRSVQMRKIRDEIKNLIESPLYTYRIENNYLPVIGEGTHTTDIVLIGEAPGKNEAKTGRPFCGTAGAVLDAALENINISRDSIYITNIIKDRPQQNRDPSPEEIDIYGPFLERQLEIIAPKIIVTLGRYAMNYVMKKYRPECRLETIGVMHGKSYTASTPYGEIVIIPQYHPAATIYNRKLIPILEEDFKVISEVLHSMHGKV